MEEEEEWEKKKNYSIGQSLSSITWTSYVNDYPWNTRSENFNTYCYVWALAKNVLNSTRMSVVLGRRELSSNTEEEGEEGEIAHATTAEQEMFVPFFPSLNTFPYNEKRQRAQTL